MNYAEHKAVILARAKDLIALQHKALSTEDTYLRWIGSYIDFLEQHGRDLPDTKARVQTYLTRVAHRGCTASTQNQAYNAILYLYEQVLGQKLPEIRSLRAKRPQTHRAALDRQTTLTLLDRVQDHSGYPTRLIAHLLYACGLRVSEPLNLRIKDLDLAHSKLIIRGAKGGKDRVVNLPCSLAAQVQTQLKHARAVWEHDQTTGLPVQVPHNLHRKYPKSPHSWQWAWLFPARKPCTHPRTGQICRFHLHESAVQRAVKTAAQSMGLDSLATPHILRHCYATHHLNAGCNIRDLQEALGHSDVKTTMLYTANPARLPELI